MCVPAKQNSRKRVSAEETFSLKALYPHLADEWHPRKNPSLFPSQVVPGSAKKAWWLCSKCGHEWRTTVRHRAERGQNCPECNRWVGTSFSEQSILFYLRKVFPETESRYRYSHNGNAYELDIFIPELNIGIEYDGYYYHRQKQKTKKDLEKNLFFKNKLQLIRIREKGLPPLDTYGTLSYTRTDNNKKYLYQSIQFIFDYLLTQSRLPQSTKRRISAISIDVIKDSLSIYQLMKIQKLKESAGIKHPHLFHYWNDTKNGTLSPYQFMASNKTVVHWKCEQGHEWEESIANVTARQQYICHTCHSFGHNHPEKLGRWDWEKNEGVDPFSIPRGSKVKFWWKCENDHSYDRGLQSELNSKSCPYCNVKRINEENSLFATNPELARQWHPEKNGEITPHDVSKGSGMEAWWICDHDHEWQVQIYSRIKGDRISECPYCINLYVHKDNSLESAIKRGEASQNLLKEWDYEKNGILAPEQILSSSTKKVHWKCEHNHKWEATVFARTQGKGKCPTCSSFAFLYPELMKEWDIEKNSRIEPYRIASKSNKRVWWKCEHGHSWESFIKNRANGNGNCLSCQSVGFKFPHLLKEWDYERNVIDPFSLSSGNSRTKVHWKCPHNHTWKADAYARTNGTNHCPTCQSLGFKYPELAKEWHPNKNIELDIMTISASSGKKVWWECERGHEWEATPKHRKDGTGCPDCPKTKVTPDNQLSLLYPEISKDWDYTKNDGYTPEDFTSYSSRIADWKCHSCGHEWKAVISSRTRGWKKCQKCHP